MPTLIESTLELEEIDNELYRSKKLWKPHGARGVFGGQVIGLALKSAIQTIDKKYSVHSLHSYFILAGDSDTPIVYKVNSIRTGKTYATRSVIANQNGRPIFSMLVSFSIPEPSILNYQQAMPKVPAPELLISDESRLLSLLDDTRAEKWHASIRLRLQQPIPIESKKVPSKYYVDEGEENNKHMIWMKCKGELPDDPSVHQCVAAYCSDHELLNAALVPFDLAKISDRRVRTVKMLASLDHAIWFHEPFKADEWLLYEMVAHKMGSGRGFSMAKVWNLSGRLVFSCAQEGVIRVEIPDSKL